MANKKNTKTKTTTKTAAKKGRTAPRRARGPGILTRALGALRARIATHLRDPDALRDTVSRALTAAVIIAVAAAWIFGRAPLRRHVGETRAAVLAPDSLQWPVDASGAIPAWIPPLVLDELQRITLARLSPDPFQHDTLRAVREGLAGAGWLEDIGRITRQPDGRIVIEGRWRQPFAVIRYDGVRYVVGRGGELMRLPEAAAIQPGSDMFVITNPHLDPPMTVDGAAIQYGVPWRGDDIAAALDLIDLLKDINGAEQITGVDLARYGSSGGLAEHLVILTNSGSRIDWGKGLSAQNTPPGEVPVAHKIARLQQNYRDYGRIDRDMTARNLDLYTFSGMEIDRTAQRD